MKGPLAPLEDTRERSGTHEVQKEGMRGAKVAVVRQERGWDMLDNAKSEAAVDLLGLRVGGHYT